jgi:hypothetical protein
MTARRPSDRAAAARLLGISDVADEATVRRAFRAWAALAHPDHGGDARYFAELCDARDILLQPIRQDPVIRPHPRIPWSRVLVRPAPVSAAALLLGFVAAVAAVLIAGPAPLLAMPAAVASAAWCVAVSRMILRDADHGHVIVTRSLAWAVVAGAQISVAVLVGIRLIEVLPLLAVPFVAVIAAVNPVAGLRRAPRVNVR